MVLGRNAYFLILRFSKPVNDFTKYACPVCCCCLVAASATAMDLCSQLLSRAWLWWELGPVFVSKSRLAFQLVRFARYRLFFFLDTSTLGTCGSFWTKGAGGVMFLINNLKYRHCHPSNYFSMTPWKHLHGGHNSRGHDSWWKKTEASSFSEKCLTRQNGLCFGVTQQEVVFFFLFFLK